MLREKLQCPNCKGAVKYRDSRVRKGKNIAGEVFRYLLRRLRCQKCRKLHTEMPDVIQPYKHYDSHAIQSVLDGSEEAASCVADDSTMHRWKKSFAEKVPEINQKLASIHARKAEEKPPLIPVERILRSIRSRHKQWLGYVMAQLINNGYKLCTRFACCPKEHGGTINSVGQKTSKGGARNDKTIEDSS